MTDVHSADSEDDGPYRRTQRPMFWRESTNDVVSFLAESDNLTIYVGAGVTVDQGGPSWTDLVHELTKDPLLDEKAVGPNDREMLTSVLTPLEASTTVARYFRDALTGEDEDYINNVLISAVRSRLYPGARWNIGQLARSIATLVAARFQSQLYTTIVTTNYDTILQRELSEQLAEVGGGIDPGLLPNVQRLEDWTAGRQSDPQLAEMMYLHGQVPQFTGEPASRSIVFTENDYWRNRERAFEYLKGVLNPPSSVLIIGSSLTDAPLLEALLDKPTQDDSSRHSRIALFPIPSMVARAQHDITKIQTKALWDQYKTRMNAFGVQISVPDFYSSLSQFCDELRLVTEHKNKVGIGSPKSYLERLSLWWSEWSDGVLRNGVRRREIDAWIHDIASSYMKLLSREDYEESLKIELWAVWNPSDERRLLKRWANSAWPSSEWNDEDIANGEKMAREAEIVVNSNYAAIRALVTARPLLDTINLDGRHNPVDSPHGSRWRQVLAVPISIETHGGRIAVGAVTLMSMASNSYLSESHPTFLQSCVAVLRNVGQLSLDPEPVALGPTKSPV